MPHRSDDDGNARRPRSPDAHVASKLGAFRSQLLHDLAKDILIVRSADADGAVLTSLLRALLGRQAEAHHIADVGEARARLIETPPNLVILRESATAGLRAVDAIREFRDAGFVGPIVVVCDQLSAPDASHLRQAGALDVIEKDELNSVRLSLALLKAVGEDPSETIAIAVPKP